MFRDKRVIRFLLGLVLISQSLVLPLDSSAGVKLQLQVPSTCLVTSPSDAVSVTASRSGSAHRPVLESSVAASPVTAELS